MSDSVHVGVEVFVGVDIAKGDHYACALTSTGEEVLARSVRNDETAIRCLIDDAEAYGAVALVIDTTSSAASLLMETAARTQVPVALSTMSKQRQLGNGCVCFDCQSCPAPSPMSPNCSWGQHHPLGWLAG